MPDTQKDSQTERKTNKQNDRQTNKQADKQKAKRRNAAETNRKKCKKKKKGNLVDGFVTHSSRLISFHIIERDAGTFLINMFLMASLDHFPY